MKITIPDGIRNPEQKQRTVQDYKGYYNCDSKIPEKDTLILCITKRDKQILTDDIYRMQSALDQLILKVDCFNHGDQVCKKPIQK